MHGIVLIFLLYRFISDAPAGASDTWSRTIWYTSLIMMQLRPRWLLQLQVYMYAH